MVIMKKDNKKKKKIKVFDIIFYVGMALILIFVGVPKIKQFFYNKKFTSNPQSNALLKGLVLKDINNKEYKIDALKGKVIMFDFWASWCGPCKRKIPQINKLYNKYTRDKVMVFGINVGEREVTVKNAVKKLNISYPIVLDRQGLSSKNKFNITTLPTLIFIDKNGDISARGSYPFTSVESVVKKLLKK